MLKRMGWRKRSTMLCATMARREEKLTVYKTSCAKRNSNECKLFFSFSLAHCALPERFHFLFSYLFDHRIKIWTLLRRDDHFVRAEFPLDARDGSPRACNGSEERDQAAKRPRFSARVSIELAVYIYIRIYIHWPSYISLSTRPSLSYNSAWTRPSRARGRCFHSSLRDRIVTSVFSNQRIPIDKRRTFARAIFQGEARSPYHRNVSVRVALMRTDYVTRRLRARLRHFVWETRLLLRVARSNRRRRRRRCSRRDRRTRRSRKNSRSRNNRRNARGEVGEGKENGGWMYLSSWDSWLLSAASPPPPAPAFSASPFCSAKFCSAISSLKSLPSWSAIVDRISVWFYARRKITSVSTRLTLLQLATLDVCVCFWAQKKPRSAMQLLLSTRPYRSIAEWRRPGLSHSSLLVTRRREASRDARFLSLSLSTNRVPAFQERVTLSRNPQISV